jgi:hypothetical protein
MGAGAGAESDDESGVERRGAASADAGMALATCVLITVICLMYIAQKMRKVVMV